MLNRFSFLSLISLFCMCRTLQKTENMQRSVQIVWVHCCLLWSQVFLLHYMKWKLMHKWMRNENTTWKYCCYIPIFLLCPLFVSLLCTSFHFFHSIPCDCLVSNHFFSILCVFFSCELQRLARDSDQRLQIRIWTTNYGCYIHGSKTINYIFSQTFPNI